MTSKGNLIAPVFDAEMYRILNHQKYTVHTNTKYVETLVGKYGR
jgi:hypothetical protein